MKSAILASLLFFSTTSYACDELQALREYYSGPGITQLTFKKIGEGLYSVAYVDEHMPSRCTGGQAQVNAHCEVIPVKGLFCEWL